MDDIHHQSEKLTQLKTSLIIIHNGQSMDWVEQAVGKSSAQKMTSVLHHPENPGFAASCNIGIAEGKKNKATDFFFLNPDTRLHKNALHELLTDTHDIVAPVISFRRQEQQVYDYGGVMNWWWGRTTHRESGQYPTPASSIEIEYVSGCAMRVRESVIETIGGFDERYFLYFEDVDFCLRAKRAGYSIGITTKAVIEHDLQEDAARSYQKRLYLLDSNWQFIKQWVPWWKKPFATMYWLGLLVKNALVVIARAQPKQSR